MYFYAGNKFKSDRDIILLLSWDIYGLKSSDLMRRNNPSDILGNKIGFKASLADTDVWYKAVTDETGFEYYTYIIVYFDGILILDKIPKNYMDML